MGRTKKLTPDEQLLLAAQEKIDDSSIIVNDKENDKVTPDRRDERWSKYVLSFLTKDEWGDEQKKFPRTDALPRLIERFIGPILKSVSTIAVEPTSDNNLKVICEHNLIVQDDTYQIVREVTSIGEASELKLISPYNLYPAAIASTRAKGRSYKDVLQLKNVITAEEVDGSIDESEDSEGITSGQQVGIKNLCSRLNINMDKYIRTSWGTYNDIRELSKKFAQEKLAELNKFQQNILEIPTEFKIGENI
jgi:hypothetical protein